MLAQIFLSRINNVVHSLSCVHTDAVYIWTDGYNGGYNNWCGGVVERSSAAGASGAVSSGGSQNSELRLAVVMMPMRRAAVLRTAVLQFNCLACDAKSA